MIALNDSVITLKPTNAYQVVGGSVNFAAGGVGLAPVNYQWQFNNVNLTGATHATLTLTNVQSTNEGNYRVAITDGVSSLTSAPASFTLVTPPVITSQSTPTNRVCIYGNYVSFAASATAPAQTNGFPLHYQWQLNGTNISGANTTNYNFSVNDTNAGIYSLLVTNAAGSTNVSWTITITNAINVTNDLLLIYNTNSTDSKTVLDYYLAHRPGVGGANVLGIGYTGFYVSNAPASGIFNGMTNAYYYETISPTDLTNHILNPVANWLATNPSKLPQYVILFPDIPARVNTNNNAASSAFSYQSPNYQPSVQVQLHNDIPDWTPFVTSINMDGTNACIGYINKLTSLGTNNYSGTPFLSASANGYANTNWYFDDATYGYPTGLIGLSALQGVMSNGVPRSAIYYVPNTTSSHIYAGTNVAGLYNTGNDGGTGGNFAATMVFQGDSGWYVMETVDSYNGVRYGIDTFMQWYAPYAFGGTNYSNTPIGAVTHVDEPNLGGVENSKTYFGFWVAGKSFAICAWSARQTPYFQAIGDPFVTK